MSQTLADAFARLKPRNQIALMPFVPAGYPDLATTSAVLPAIEQAGATLIEIGVPFSDPIADGPTIQAAFSDSLAKGLKVGQVFESIAQLKSKVTIPLVSMVSFSIVYRYGLARYLKDAKEAGMSGLILPDLPPPEAQKIVDQVRSAGLDTILLVAPTTAPERRKEIARLSSGFIYYLSVTGITGERTELPKDLEANLKQLKSMTDTPVCVGFGISKPQHLKQLEGIADGAIVGSAVVKTMTQAKNEGAETIAKDVASYCRDLLSMVR